MKAADERDRQKDRDKQRHTLKHQFMLKNNNNVADTFDCCWIHEFLYASYFSVFFVFIEYLSGCDYFIGVKPNGIDAGLHQHTRK